MAMESLVMKAALDLVGLKLEANAVLMEKNEAFEIDQQAWQHLVQAFLEQRAGIAERLLVQTDVFAEYRTCSRVEEEEEERRKRKEEGDIVEEEEEEGRRKKRRRRHESVPRR
ncbi:hypothetical protein B296_00023468 [Ensete ventricosum]|uniref:Uncharacterized protein n=1 Tax=Ensete ventricosum TaxID=4639 RepID=A0A426YFQ2_ENSVE|nr:hypothetical protein B296_00023468 [Ensete ventricosum]